ncbi:MAG TPA: 50S ribosomal protein L3 [Gammaproteobacteria bacterium]|jgi:large subunit ribosomal protein L3|nr:50S ribosomal protein L3 [Gammaproteobacteria bacterium]HJP37898.1 50S ribosomal protein L3 [Gammaproteobacteria bacterium]
MAIGLIGRKTGMSRVFTDDGASVPVTIIQVLPNRVTRIKTEESDGYSALQVTTGSVKPQRISKAVAGQYAAVSAEPGEGLFEFRVDSTDLAEIEAGAEFTVEHFAAGQIVDVTGTSIGKGYAGTVKRHNFATQDFTHGNSLAHRAPGSIGQNQTPGRVFKGKKMSGQMGNVRRTAQGLEVVKIDAERNLIAVKGAVPGSKGGRLIVKPTIKVSAKSSK